MNKPRLFNRRFSSEPFGNRLKIRTLMIIVTVLFLILISLVFMLVFYQVQSRALLEGIDRELLTAALMAKEVLPANYHDRITSPEALPDAEYQQVVERFNHICLETGMDYLWSVMLLDQTVVFTSATSPSKDASHRDHAGFLEVHSNPGAYLPAFESMQPQFQINEDKWGRIRAVLVPFYDANGRKFLVGASRRMQEVDTQMYKLGMLSFLLGSCFVALGTLVSVALIDAFVRPIDAFKDAVSKVAAGDYSVQDSVLSGSAIYNEMASLASSFETMRQAIRAREESLKKREEQYRILTENIKDVVWILDVDTLRFRYVSPSVYKMRGYSAEEILAQPVTHAMLPAVSELWVQRIRARVEDFRMGRQPPDRFYTDELEQPCKDGSSIWVEVISSYYFNPENERFEVRGVTREISARKQVEDALRRSEEKFSTVFHRNRIPMALLTVADGCFRDVNIGFSQASGYTLQEVFGRTAYELDIWVYPQQRDYILSEIATRGQLIDYEMTARMKSGAQRVFSWSADTVMINDQPCLLVSVVDITERKKVEEKAQAGQAELQRLLLEAERSRQVLLSLLEDQKEAEEQIHQLNRKLEQRVRERTALLTAANQELEAFSYSVSHDLRAPLRALHGFSAALQEDYATQLDEQGRHYLFRIQEAAQRMGQLINDLLNLSKVTRAEFSRREVDISALAQSIAAELQAQTPQRQVNFEISPGLVVSGDANLLKIALENLLNNAHKFTGKCEHAVIQVGRVEQNGSAVYFVRDNGAGFNMEYASRLFTPFQRLHGAQEFPGTGIGLSIAQRIIARHGGRIWPESQVGQGTTFYFTL